MIIRNSIGNILVGVIIFIVFFLSLGLAIFIFYFVFELLSPFYGGTFARPEMRLLWVFGLSIVFFVGSLWNIILSMFGRDWGYFLKKGQFFEFDELINEVALDLNVPSPQIVYLLADPAAFAYEPIRLGGGKRILIIGWPLFRALSTLELKAVIAHELAHFDKNAFFVHHALWRVEILIQMQKKRTIDSAGGWYALLIAKLHLVMILPIYRIVTKTMFHKYELYCDSQAAQLYGSNVLMSALKKVIKLQIAFDRFTKEYSSGSRNFYRDFFDYYFFLAKEGVLDRILTQEFQSESFTHPSLGKRQGNIKEFSKRPDTNEKLNLDQDQLSELRDDLLHYFESIDSKEGVQRV